MAKIACRSGSKCSNKHCSFKHPSERKFPCRFGAECTEKDKECKYWHPAEAESKPVKTGSAKPAVPAKTGIQSQKVTIKLHNGQEMIGTFIPDVVMEPKANSNAPKKAERKAEDGPKKPIPPPPARPAPSSKPKANSNAPKKAERKAEVDDEDSSEVNEPNDGPDDWGEFMDSLDSPSSKGKPNHPKPPKVKKDSSEKTGDHRKEGRQHHKNHRSEPKGDEGDELRKQLSLLTKQVSSLQKKLAKSSD
jgi:hypothetical protein